MRTTFSLPTIAFTLLIASLSCSKTDNDLLGPNDFSENKSESFVDEKLAVIVANNFTGRKPATKTLDCLVQDDYVLRPISRNGKILLYVINYRGGGFMLVSATKDYYPVLAFSETGSFDCEKIEGGLYLWFQDMQAKIAESASLDDQTKSQIEKVWNAYEDRALYFGAVTKSSSSAEQACWERCEELYNQYSQDGWNFAPLSTVQSVFDEAGFSDFYDQLCYSADFNHSSLNCSVVGWKNGIILKEVGPLLSTQWNQAPPFEDLCNGYAAGCAAIAIAQVMKYYEHPESFQYNGEDITWEFIPDTVKAGQPSDHAKLIKYIGEKVNMHYWSSGSWTIPGNVESGLEEIGYNVTRDNNNDPFTLMNEVTNGKRPVIMLGSSRDLEVLPGDAEYIKYSHYWVCDGGREDEVGGMQVFAEWQPYDCGQFTQHYYSIDNPYNLDGFNTYSFYHMNWGWGGSKDGWYLNNGIEYLHSRQNYYISRKTYKL